MSYIKTDLRLFAVDGKEKFVGKALHALLKERLIYMNEITKTVSQHEEAYQFREKVH